MKSKAASKVFSAFLVILVGILATSSAVLADCVEDFVVRSKASKAQLVWTAVPDNAGYEVFRSSELIPTDFALIANVEPSTSLLLDFPPGNGLTYLYRVSALVPSGACASRVVATHLSSRRGRGKNSAPVIYTEPTVAGPQGRQYRYEVGAADPEDDELEFILAAAPAGMVIDPLTGLITWLPELPGVATVELLVRDSVGNEATQTFIVDIADTNLGGTVELIGSAGGSVIDDTGVGVFVPPGALAEDTLIGVQGLPFIELLPGQVPSPQLPFLSGASLGPDGLQFNEAVMVVVPISQLLDEGTPLPVLVYSGDQNTWEELEEPATVLAGGLTAQFQTNHFSAFTVFRADDEAAGLFGEIDAVTLFDDFMAQVENRFANLFNFDSGEVVFDPGPSALPGQENLDFLNCYQFTGAQFVLETNQGRALRTRGCQSPEACAATREQAELVFIFFREFDETFETPAGPARFIGNVAAELYYESTSPTLELEVSDGQLWVGQQTSVKLSLLCGQQGFKEQQVDVLIKEGFNLAAVDPVTGTTSAQGTFDTTIYANPTDGGAVVVSGLYVWTNSLGTRQFEVVPMPDADIDILSLTGDWDASGDGEDFNCDDPEDDGSGSGSGSVSITQTKFSISGGGDGLTFGATITPGEGDAFSLGGNWRFEDSSGNWGGGGTVSSGVINFSGSGSGGGCRTRGGGTLERK